MGIFEKRTNLPFLVVCVGQACNLKCKNCGNLVPYSKKESLRYDIADILANLNVIFDAFYRIDNIQIQGGEPFIYTDLIELIDVIAKYRKCKNIVVATNGTIIPQDDLLRFLAKNRCIVRISDYQLSSSKGMELKCKCEEFGVKYFYYSFANDSGEWIYLGEKDINKENDDIVVKKRYKHCQFRKCLTLEKGFLANCSRAINSQDVFGFESKGSDYVRVEKTQDFAKKVLEYMNSDIPMEACRFCMGTLDSNKCIAAEQM